MWRIKEVKLSSEVTEFQVTDGSQEYAVFYSIKDAEECKNFFNDLCTPSELEEFTSRWLIARLLDTKKSYREIASQTGASTTTIGRVARFIKYGNNGYKTILELSLIHI